MRRILTLASGAWLAAGFAAPQALAQAQFLIRAQQGQVVQTINDGATLSFATEGIGQASTAAVTVTYRGSTTAALGSFEFNGPTDFSVTSNPPLPVVLNPMEVVSFVITFQPSANGRFTGRLGIPFTEGRTSAVLNLNLVGVLPEFGFSSALLPRGNQNSIPAGGAIPFPDTTVNQTNSAAFIISNRGSGPGTVNNISVTGAAFTLAGVPLLPATLNAGQEVRITVVFSPTQQVSSQGSLTVDLVGRSVSVSLAGLGIGASYAYEFLQGSSTRPIAPNDSLTLPATNVTEKNTAVVRVRNTGNGDGVVSNIRVSGAAEITLTDVPFLPLTLTPGASLNFTIQFAPTTPSTVTTRLRVDDAFFNVSATGLGSTLAYAYVVGSSTTTVANNGSVALQPAAVGSTSQARFTVSNTGNAPAFVTSVSLTAAAQTVVPVFSLAEAPSLPARIGGGESISFNIVFFPIAIGSATATLRVDALTFNVSAVGSDPPPLPRVTFPGPTATAEAATQVSVGVSLERTYPVNLTGRLLLSFTSDVFADDPAVQFSSGARNLPFVIPANSTRAVFGVTATEVRLQTGTVAGTITLAAAFATEAGNINLTPTLAPATTIAIRPAAPRIRSLQLATRTASGFSVLVTGYATGRAVTGMAFQFAQARDPDKTDLKLETASVNLNVEGPFTAYYGSAAATPFGSQFTATVNFNVRGDIDAIQSVSVVCSNAQGNSNSMAVNLR